MPNKKQQINPFSVYMREQEPLLRRRGIVFSSKEELVTYLHPHFKGLSDFDRQKYVNIAKMERERQKADLTRKFDDRGVPLSQIEAERREERENFESMCSHIVRMLKDRGGCDSLLSLKLYTMFSTLYCYTDDGKQSVYLPCEVGVSEWTLADGVLRTCSFVVKPDQIPCGYKSMCREISESTHQVPFNGFAGAESDYPGLWIRLRNFINQDEHLAEYPPVFTLTAEVEPLTGCLQWLHERSMDRRRSPFRVYRLELLLFELLQLAGRPQLEAQCADTLRSGMHDHVLDIACRFHADGDNARHCARAMAHRAAYTILELVSPMFGVALVGNRHVPQAPSGNFQAEEPFVGLTRFRTDPIEMKPTRERKPNLPTEYHLIQPTQSQFVGVGWDVSDTNRKPWQENQEKKEADEVVDSRPKWGLTVGSASVNLSSSEFPSLSSSEASVGSGRGKGVVSAESRGKPARSRVIGRGHR